MDFEKSLKVLGALLAGIGLGLLVGIVVAPEKGERTSRNLINRGYRLKDDIEEVIDDVADRAKSRLDRIRNGK